MTDQTTSSGGELRRLWTLLGKEGPLDDAIAKHGPGQLLTRLRREHARHQAQADQPVFLHRRPHRNYTRDEHLAANREPEVIDPQAAEHLADEARRRHEILHAGELARKRDRSQITRLRHLQAQARKEGVDVSPDIQALLDAITAKLKRPGAGEEQAA